MKNVRTAITALLLLCLCCGAAHAETIPANYRSKTKVASGYFATVSSLCLFDDFDDPQAVERYEDAWSAVKDLLEEIEQTISVAIPTSDIAAFNALPEGGQISIRPLTAQLIKLAQRMYKETQGYYDPTVYPLVDLWGFSPRFTLGSEADMPYDRERENGTLPPPDSAYIDGFLKLVGMNGIALHGSDDEGYTLVKQTPSVEIAGVVYHAQLDLGGIAKGYAVDLIRALLQERGYRYGYFSCGSSSVYVMKSASVSARKAGDSRFHLEVRSPRETPAGSSSYASVALENSSLSSSGDYGRNYELNGQRYCHIINPFTGYPMNVSTGTQSGVCTVTLLSSSAAEDDAYTTALCLMGLEDAIAYINSSAKEQEVVLVYYRADSEHYEVITNLPDERITLLDDAYVMSSRIDASGAVVYTGTLLAR